MKTILLSILMLTSTFTFAGNERAFSEHKVPVGNNNLYAKDYPGHGPTIILLHGYPDNHTLYDSLIPYLNDKHIIVFDFMGWGLSDKPKPKNYNYCSAQEEIEIEAVVDYFKLPSVILVPHDMSGPAAINWSLDHKEKSAGLIVLNTFYHNSKNRKIPFTGVLLSTPVIRQITLPFCIPNFLWTPVLKLSVHGFFMTKETRNAFVPKFMDQFNTFAGKRPFFKTIKETKILARNNAKRLNDVKQFNKPVCIIFGTGDQYLGEPMAEEFHTLFPNSELHLINTAKHYPQIDSAKEVGEIINQFAKQYVSN